MRCNFSFRLLLCLSAALLAASDAYAGTSVTWRGTGTNSNWSTANNWSATLDNSTTYGLVFSGTTRTTNTNTVGGTSSTVTADSILFSNNNTAGQNAQFTIGTASNRTITLTNGATISTTAASTGSLTDIIQGRLVANGTVNVNTGNNHGVNIIAAWSGAPTIVKTGAGSLQLGPTSASSFSGLTVSNGRVLLNNSNAVQGFAGITATLGSGSTTGTVQFNTAGSSGSTNMNFSMNGNSTILVTGSSRQTFTNAQFNAPSSYASAATLTLGGVGGETQTVQGVIANNVGTVSVAVEADNAWVLNGANTYTGATTVGSSAKLLVNGSLANSGLTVSSGGYLGGNGTISGLTTVSGTISPGGTSTSGGVINPTIDTLRVDSLLMKPSATALIDITGTSGGSYDSIVGTSAMTFDGTLKMNMTGSYDTVQLWTDHQVWNLFSGFTSYNRGLDFINFTATGTPFAGMTFALTGTAGIWETTTATADAMGLKLQFNENNGTLAVVPEPSTIVFAGIGMAMFGWRTWTSRRRKALLNSGIESQKA